MTKRPFPSEVLDPTGNRELSQILGSDGVLLPDDIGELCSYLDDGSSPVDGTVLRSRDQRGSLARKKEKIKRLKTVNRALEQDLACSRRVGSRLESDMARLRRQHRRELRHGDRTQRKMRVRKDAVARLDARLQASLCLQEKHEVSAVLRDLVGRVELAIEHGTTERAEEALAWSELQQRDQRDCTVRLEKERREAEDLLVVEQQLLVRRVERLETRLQSAQQHLRDEKEAGAELQASYAQLEQDVANKSGWLTALALSSMSLVSAQVHQATCMEAERDKWQRSNSELQLKYEELQVEDSKHQSELSAENAQLRDKLQTAHKVAKRCKHKYKKVKAEVRALRGQLNVAKGSTTQANTHFTPNVLKPDHSHAGRLRTLRGTKNRRGRT